MEDQGNKEEICGGHVKENKTWKKEIKEVKPNLA